VLERENKFRNITLYIRCLAPLSKGEPEGVREVSSILATHELITLAAKPLCIRPTPFVKNIVPDQMLILGYLSCLVKT